MRTPSIVELQGRAAAFGFALSAGAASEYAELIELGLEPFRQLAALGDPPSLMPSRHSWRPSREDNPLNAWAVRTALCTDGGGLLTGRTVALKDNICLAGVPLLAGSALLEGFIPDIDATVAQRVLAAGAEILGKAHCEPLSRSGSSHNSPDGPIRNPVSARHSAGGSSSGCAALVAAGHVDMAIGGDQVGSIRLPSSFCNIVGLKPTYGLVPYTGVLPLEHTLDHVGPMTRTVTDNALLLESIAGYDDGRDPRQQAAAPRRSVLEQLGQPVSGLRIGLVLEGFGHATSSPEVDHAVHGAAIAFSELGATVVDVSVPEHSLGLPALLAILVQGNADQLAAGCLVSNWRGEFPVCFADAFADLHTRAELLPERVKIDLLVADHINRHHGRRLYARAQNIGRDLARRYDGLLESVDLLLLPTAPQTAPLLPAADAGRAEQLGPPISIAANTAPFNLTGHPAITLPCGKANGLPVGAMLISAMYDEPLIYRAARALETTLTGG